MADPLPCKIAQGYRDPSGYVWMPDHRRKAHRVAYADAYGPIPSGKVILHLCDEPACVEPTHLRAGTLSENTQDMMAKGRARFAGDCLSPDAVREIRRRAADGESQRSIARDFGRAFTTINRIVLRHTWKEVT